MISSVQCTQLVQCFNNKILVCSEHVPNFIEQNYGFALNMKETHCALFNLSKSLLLHFKLDMVLLSWSIVLPIPGPHLLFNTVYISTIISLPIASKSCFTLKVTFCPKYFSGNLILTTSTILYVLCEVLHKRMAPGYGWIPLVNTASAGGWPLA